MAALQSPYCYYIQASRANPKTQLTNDLIETRPISNQSTNTRSLSVSNSNPSISSKHPGDSNPHSNPTKEPISRLLALPAELRNEIYNYLLCPNPTPIHTLAKTTANTPVTGHNTASTQISLHPAILSTCRQTHDEALPLLYSYYTFNAHPSLLTTLPNLLGPSHPVYFPSVLKLICRWHLSLRLDTDPMFTAAQAMEQFSGAEYLELYVWQAQFEACDLGVLKLFKGVRGVRVARVGGSVGADVARWLEGVMMGEKEEEGCGCEGFGREGEEVVCRRCGNRENVGEVLGMGRDIWKFGGR